MSPQALEKIRAAIARQKLRDAARKIRLAERGTAGPAPGDLYWTTVNKFDGFWLVLRPHPDDPNLLLAAPVDDGLFAEPTDVAGPPPWIVKCGQCEWLPLATFRVDRRVEVFAERFVSAARQVLADLARGRTPQHAVEIDTANNDEELR